MFGYSKLMKQVFREDCYSIGIRRKNEENGLLFEGNYFQSYFFNEYKVGYVKDIVRFLIYSTIICGICSWLVNKIILDGILVLLVRGIVCVSFANFCLWCLFNRTDEYQACKKLIIALLRKQREGSS